MAGRPTKMTRATLGKLREAFLLGATDEEACLFAQIHPDTLYEYQKQQPEFSEEKEVWKQNPTLKARKTVFDNLDVPKVAMWYLERKIRKEFGTKDPSEPEEIRGVIGITYKVPCGHEDCAEGYSNQPESSVKNA